MLLSLSPDVWPGSGLQALQLLAFVLAWLRQWWTDPLGGGLRISEGLQAGLKAWAARGAASAAERSLAAELLQDFGGSSDAGSTGSCSAAADGGDINSCGGAPGVGVAGGLEHVVSVCEGEVGTALHVVTDATHINRGPGSEAAALNEAGGAAFRARDWAGAARLYG